jgi:hypothetical protein
MLCGVCQDGRSYVRAEKSSPACVGTGVYVKTAQGLMRGLPRDLCEDSGLCDNSGIEDWGLCKDWGFARTGFYVRTWFM